MSDVYNTIRQIIMFVQILALSEGSNLYPLIFPDDDVFQQPSPMDGGHRGQVVGGPVPV